MKRFVADRERWRLDEILGRKAVSVFSYFLHGMIDTYKLKL